MEIEDGKVKSLYVEPDNTGLNGTFWDLHFFDITNGCVLVSAAEKVLG